MVFCRQFGVWACHPLPRLRCRGAIRSPSMTNDQPSGAKPPTAAVIDEVAATADAIASDPATAGPKWGIVHKLMLKAKVPPADAAKLIVGRDLDGLRALVSSWRGEAPATPPAGDESESTPATAAAKVVDPARMKDEMKAAMKAFRKRLKVTRLDHESRLGVGPLTGGKGHEVDAILPPREFDDEVWRALVAAGSLRDVGRGFFALPEDIDSR